MKKFAVIISLFVLSIILNGCLIFHTISYDLSINEDNSGTADVVLRDIRSDAVGNSEFEEDKKNLFDYMLKSDQFIEEMKKEGKNIISRDLEVNGDTLIGKVTFKFDDISKVEGIINDAGFYFLTLPLADKIQSTNGTVVESKDYKRILWDDKIKNLKFTMVSFEFAEENYRSLAEFYKSDN